MVMSKIPSCSIIIPIYNSQESLPDLISEINDILPGIVNKFEIVLVNDGSKDQSWQVVNKLCEQYPVIRAFDLMKNYGQHNALLCGIRQAKYDVIVTMDDDLQHPPSEISKLFDKLDNGFDVVYGTPCKQTHGLWRDFSSKLIKWILKVIIHIPYAEGISSFRVFRTTLRESFSSFSNSYVSIDVLLSWGTGKIGFVEVEHHKRKVGASQYSFLKLLKHASNLVLGLSVLPLRLASILGFVFTIFGMGILAYVFLRYLIQGGSVPGFSFLASTIAIFSGIILFVLGIIGEYLARMYLNLMTKPAYTINAVVDNYYDK